MAHGCGGGGTSRQVTCVLVLPPKDARRWTAHALCYFDSFLQPRWFAGVIWTPVNLVARHSQENRAVYWDAAQTFRLG
jgi:hypothetical protein